MSRNGNVLSSFEALGAQTAAVLDVDEALIDGEVNRGRRDWSTTVLRTRANVRSAKSCGGRSTRG
jgi:hypothetical protein